MAGDSVEDLERSLDKLNGQLDIAQAGCTGILVGLIPLAVWGVVIVGLEILDRIR